MNIHKLHDNVFIEGYEFKPNEFNVTKSNIYHDQSANKFTVTITAEPTGDMKKVIEAVSFNDHWLQRSFKATYDYRGRKTEQQHRDAENEARTEMNKKLDDNYYQAKVLDKIELELESRVKRGNDSYLSHAERIFKDDTPISYDKSEDKKLAYHEEELTVIQAKIDALKDLRRHHEQAKKNRLNTLFLKEVEEAGGMNSLWEKSEITWPEEAEQMIKELAENNELFPTPKRFGF